MEDKQIELRGQAARSGNAIWQKTTRETRRVSPRDFLMCRSALSVCACSLSRVETFQAEVFQPLMFAYSEKKVL